MEIEREVKLLEIFYTIKPLLEKEKYFVSDYKLINYGLQFSISSGKWKGVIRLYLNKKNRLKIDYSPLKDDEKSRKAIRIIEKNRATFDPKRAEIDSEFDLGYPIIGTDESGKGDYFGPLVSAAVYLDKRAAHELLGYKVKDSKKIKDKAISDLSEEIKKICKWKFSVVEITPKRYNGLYQKFQKENKNLNSILAWEHAKAIENLLDKVSCDKAIVDKFAKKRFILNKLQYKGKKLKIIQKTKAESNIAVATASILAREAFLNRMNKLSEKYEIDFPKGATSNVITTGKQFVEQYGEDELGNVAKLHFRTTERILK